MFSHAGMLGLLGPLVFLPLQKVQAFSEDPAAPAASSERLFRGRVLDRESLQPIKGVQVRRFDGKVEVQTDERGLFAFPMDLERFGACHYSAEGVACTEDDPETTRFFLRCEGMSPVLVAPEKYRNWEQTITLLLWRRASLEGVWLDADGQPVACRELTLTSVAVLPYDCEEQFADVDVTTDENGSFRFDGVAARVAWSLRAANKKDRLVELDGASVVLRPGETRTLTLRSSKMIHVSGIVRDSKGRTQQGARVALGSARGDLFADTAADGRFTFDRVSMGRSELKAMYPAEYDGVKECRATTLNVTGTEREVFADLQLLPVEQIEGRVLDAGGKPVGGAEVWFEPETMSYSGRVSARNDGSFRLRGLFAGECHMVANGRNRVARSAVSVVNTGTTDLELTLEPTGRITGRVPVGTLAKPETITIHAACRVPRPANPDFFIGRASLSMELEPDHDTFEIAGLPVGSWAVTACTDNGQVSAERIVTVEADKDASCPDLVLKPSSNLWLISAPGSGAIDIELWNKAELLLRTVLADERLDPLHVPAGDLRLVARQSGNLVGERHLELTPGAQQLVGLAFGN